MIVYHIIYTVNGVNSDFLASLQCDSSFPGGMKLWLGTWEKVSQHRWSIWRVPMRISGGVMFGLADKYPSWIKICWPFCTSWRVRAVCVLKITFWLMSHLLLFFSFFVKPQRKIGAMRWNAPHAIVLREVFVSDGDLSFIACTKRWQLYRSPHQAGRKHGVIYGDFWVICNSG